MLMGEGQKEDLQSHLVQLLDVEEKVSWTKSSVHPPLCIMGYLLSVWPGPPPIMQITLKSDAKTCVWEVSPERFRLYQMLVCFRAEIQKGLQGQGTKSVHHSCEKVEEPLSSYDICIEIIRYLRYLQYMPVMCIFFFLVTEIRGKGQQCRLSVIRLQFFVMIIKSCPWVLTEVQSRPYQPDQSKIQNCLNMYPGTSFLRRTEETLY